MIFKRRRARNNILKWMENNKTKHISFEELETKVYEVCEGMNYKDTLAVFKCALDKLNGYNSEHTDEGLVSDKI